MDLLEPEKAIPSYGVTEAGLETPRESRKASPKRAIQLDFARGLAILFVIGYHAISADTYNGVYRAIEFPFKQFGWTGVDLFFVLSGFLVGGLLIGEHASRGSIRIGRFIKRRGFKIWPAYYFYLLFQLITRHFPPSTFVIANFIHLQNYLGTSLSHTWTLAVEEHFYLALPFLLTIIFRYERLQRNVVSLLIGICIAVLALRSWMVLYLGSTRVWEYTHTRIDSLLFGVLLSYLYQCRRESFNRLMNQKALLSVISVLGITFLCLVQDTSVLMHTVGYTLNYLTYGSILLLLLSAGERWTARGFYRSIAWIGVYSYSIYLWHVSVRHPLSKLAEHIHGTLQWPILFGSQYVAAICLGVIMAKAIEWPFLHLREKLIPASD